MPRDVFESFCVQHLYGCERGETVVNKVATLKEGVVLYEGSNSSFSHLDVGVLESAGIGTDSHSLQIEDEAFELATQWLEHSCTQPLSFLPAPMYDVVIDEEEYYSFKVASSKLRVYVLFPSLSMFPMWLRQQFKLLHAEAHVDWENGAVPRLGTWLLTSEQLEAAQKQTLRVWISKELFTVGQEVKLGGTCGSGDFFEYPYILAFQADEAAFAHDLQHTSLAASLRSSGESALLRDFSMFHSMKHFSQRTYTQDHHCAYKRKGVMKLLRKWVRNPSATTHFEQELLVIVAINPRPLSCIAAILKAITKIMDQREEWRILMTDSFNRFQSLTNAMLFRLKDVVGVSSMRALEETLDPQVSPSEKALRLIQDTSPWKVMLRIYNYDFMASSGVVSYMGYRWKGLSFAQLSKRRDATDVCLLTPMCVYAILRDWGFAEPTTEIVLKAISHLFHRTVMTSREFFDSPQGRWSLHCLVEIIFIITYQLQLFATHSSYSIHMQNLLMLFFIGNMYECYLIFRYKNNGKIRKYLKDRFPLNIFSFPLSFVLFVLTLLSALQHHRGVNFTEDGVNWVQVLYASCAIFVWFRTLGIVVVPLFRSVAQQITIFLRMTFEIMAFLFPVLAIILGFGTFFSSVYQDFDSQDFGSVFRTLLTLVSGIFRKVNPGLFIGQDDIPLFLQIYGVIMMCFYLILTGILLFNLLIAIMNSNYDPEKFDKQATLRLAEIQDQYTIQVQHHFVCSPFNLAAMVLSIFRYPSGLRPKAYYYTSQRWLLPPVDGHALPNDRTIQRPTGLGELPHLFGLLVLYPVTKAMTLLLFLLYTPFAVFHFAVWGWTSWFSKERLAALRGRSLKVVKAPKSLPHHLQKISTSGITAVETSNIAAAPTQITPAISDPTALPLPRIVLKHVLLFLPMLVWGLILYLLVLGLGALVLWAGLYVWGAKLCFSIRNVLCVLWERKEKEEDVVEMTKPNVRVLLTPEEILKAMSASDLSEHQPLVRAAYEALGKVEPEDPDGGATYLKPSHSGHVGGFLHRLCVHLSKQKPSQAKEEAMEQRQSQTLRQKISLPKKKELQERLGKLQVELGQLESFVAMRKDKLAKVRKLVQQLGDDEDLPATL